MQLRGLSIPKSVGQVSRVEIQIEVDTVAMRLIFFSSTAQVLLLWIFSGSEAQPHRVITFI